MAIRRSWSDLDVDLLSLIFQRLPTIDRVRFRLVCAAWHSVSPAPFHPAAREPLWLLLRPSDRPGLDYDDIPRHRVPLHVYNLIEEKTYEFKRLPGIPDSGSIKVVGCSLDGWLLYNLYCRLRCVHLASGKELRLPSIATLPEVDRFETNSLGHVSAYYITFNSILPSTRYDPMSLWNHYQRAIVYFPSNSPSSNGCCTRGKRSYTVVAVSICGSVVFAREGDTSWNKIATTRNCATYDVLLHNDTVYVSSSDFGKGETLCINLSTDPPSLSSHILMPKHMVPVSIEFLFCDTVHLAEIDGQIWQIWRYIDSYTINEDTDDSIDQTSLFRVAKLNNEKTMWVEMSSIDQYAVFIGENHSLALSEASFPQLSKGSIYFAEERWDPHLCQVACELMKFNLHDRSMKSCKRLPHCSDSHGTAWLIPFSF